MRGALFSATVVGTATTALLSTLPVVGTRSRARLLRPHLDAPSTDEDTTERDDLDHPLAIMGDRVAALFDSLSGISEPLRTRLDRVHAPISTADVRFRQGTAFVVLLALTGALVGTVVPRPELAAILLLTVPTLGALVPEAQATLRARRWSESVRSELPVVGEELVARLRSGQSATAAIAAIGDPTGSPIRRDLDRVASHLRHGGDLDEALRAWSTVSAADGVHRLGQVLSLRERTPDLAQLVRREVDAIRAEQHRDLLATIDTRAQQVWIPVTVAALVPGAIFLLIPFFDALRLFGASD